MRPKRQTTATRPNGKAAPVVDTATPAAAEWAALVRAARSAVHTLCVRRPEFVAGGFTDETFMAARVASATIDLLAGDPAAAPDAVVRVRRMHARLEETSLDVLAHEVEVAATNQRTARKPETREALLDVFLRRIGPHLEGLGVMPHRIPRTDVSAVLERWRRRPVARRGELSTRGVVIQLLVKAGEDEQNAKKRVERATPARD